MQIYNDFCIRYNDYEYRTKTIMNAIISIAALTDMILGIVKYCDVS